MMSWMTDPTWETAGKVGAACYLPGAGCRALEQLGRSELVA